MLTQKNITNMQNPALVKENEYRQDLYVTMFEHIIDEHFIKTAGHFYIDLETLRNELADKVEMSEPITLLEVYDLFEKTLDEYVDEALDNKINVNYEYNDSLRCFYIYINL